MKDLRFEWDKRKNRSNIRRHGVAFEEAQTVFTDENGILIDDPENSEVEDRFVLIGFSFGSGFLSSAIATVRMMSSGSFRHERQIGVRALLMAVGGRHEKEL